MHNSPPSNKGTKNENRSKYFPKPGISMGKVVAKKFLRASLAIESMYRLMPFATDADPIEYSNNKFQPIIKATNSPTVQYE